MRVIQKQARTATDILGDQKFKPGTTGRFLTYCVAVTCDEGMLLHNVLTKEVVLLEGEESALIYADDLSQSPVLHQSDSELFRELFKRWFIVPEDTDDRTMCLDLREVAQLLEGTRKPAAITGYTILTTTDCNARCFYCYEKGCAHVDMNRETALKTVDFIEEHCGGKRVTLNWFGGEPLYNLEAIESITQELKRRNIRFNSHMTSNGYLFDDEVVRKAKEQWKLQRVQITLDGTEDIYNRRKAYIYHEGSAFQRVTENIQRLLDAKIRVSIRLNVDKHNYDDLEQLCAWLANRYKEESMLSVYARYMFSIDGQSHAPLGGEVETLCDYMMRLENKLRALGLQRPSNLRKTLKLNCCMADSDAAILIQADGSLGQCEHFYDSMPCGSVEQGILDGDVVNYWKRLEPDSDVCKRCAIYPDCFRLVGCSTTYLQACQTVPALRKNKLNQLKKSIVNCYSNTCACYETKGTQS